MVQKTNESITTRQRPGGLPGQAEPRAEHRGAEEPRPGAQDTVGGGWVFIYS